MPAKDFRTIQYHPISMYRVFRGDESGRPVAIPFQIDERDHYGDFILSYGKNPNTQFSNQIFDGADELAIMGNDVGIVKTPTKWDQIKKPAILYEVLFQKDQEKGAVYIGVYFNNPPPISTANYVSFDLKAAEVRTARYHYRFDNKNYLVVRGVDILEKSSEPRPLLNSSTFYLKTDLKYFVTMEINQTDIQSELDAYYVGPVRAIARVNFNYSLLQLKFDLGMYTEVSFFANSVILPAIVDNPFDGPKILNKGSLFYYGFYLKDPPKGLKIETNMPPYKKESALERFFSASTAGPVDAYWVTALGPSYLVYLEMIPSLQMRKDQNFPMFFIDESSDEDLQKRTDKPAKLGSSKVNMAVAFGIDNLQKGVHEIAFQLFIENTTDPKYLEHYKSLKKWNIQINRLKES